MTNPVDKVREIMGRAEAVDLPDEVAVAPSSGGGGMDMPPPPPPPPPEEGEAPPPEREGAGHPLNDYGNGLRFVLYSGEDLMFVPRVGWFVWSGTHWKRDDDQIAVRGLAHGLSKRIAAETWYLRPSDDEMAVIAAADAADKELMEIILKPEPEADDRRRKAEIEHLQKQASRIKARWDKDVSRHLTFAKDAGNTGRIDKFIQESSIMLARPLEGLDAAALDVNCLSGVLRFKVTDMREEGAGRVAGVEVLPHAREQLISKIMPVSYDPDATCPSFDAFLAEIQPIPEMRRFLARWFGLSMTALTGEQKFAFFFGSGANGKSVLIDLMARVMGDYAASAKIESLTGTNRRGGGDATPDLVPLVGARMVRTSEPDEGMRLQEGLIKELTGGEPILIRALNTNFILVYPHFKLTVSGNHKPEIHGGDDGIWRRVMLVDFPVQIPAARRRAKSDMDAMLWAERDGICRWLVDGLLDYLEGGLQVPDLVAAATQEYREDSDPYGTFLTQCCHVSGDQRDMIAARDLVQAFNFWLEEQGKGSFRPGTVAKRMAGMARRWKSPATQRTFEPHKASTMSYRGIRFNDVFGRRWRDAPRDHKGNVIHGRTAEGDEGGGV